MGIENNELINETGDPLNRVQPRCSFKEIASASRAPVMQRYLLFPWFIRHYLNAPMTLPHITEAD